MGVETHLSDIYRLLAACFCSPERETLLQENVPDQLHQALEKLCPQAADFSSRLAEQLTDATQEELEVEYARLFVGPHALPAPPYGSVYMDGDRSVMGPSTKEVARLYAAAGLEVDVENAEPADHIAVELEFVHYLASEEARLRREGDEQRATELGDLRRLFLNRLVFPWVPSFCDDVRAHTESPYFGTLAGTLKSFLCDREVPRLGADA